MASVAVYFSINFYPCLKYWGLTYNIIWVTRRISSRTQNPIQLYSSTKNLLTYHDPDFTLCNKYLIISSITEGSSPQEVSLTHLRTTFLTLIKLRIDWTTKQITSVVPSMIKEKSMVCLCEKKALLQQHWSRAVTLDVTQLCLKYHRSLYTLWQWELCKKYIIRSYIKTHCPDGLSTGDKLRSSHSLWKTFPP